MSKKADTASALAGILKARRGEDAPAPANAPPAASAAVETPAPPSPALPAAPPPAHAPPSEPARPFRQRGKSSDKENYSQYSIYLRKLTRKRVNRKLDELETGMDFSELVENLLEQWLKSST